MKSYQLAILLAALTASCSSCGDEVAPPQTPLSEICPATPLPPQDCIIPEIAQPKSYQIKTTEDFAPICNSTCTRADSISIQLESDIDEALNMGNLEYIIDLNISTYDMVRHVKGLDKVKSIDRFQIYSESVQKISGLGQLKDMFQFELKDCNNLEEITEPLAVEDMSEANKTILIGGNGKLKSLKFLSNLKRIHFLQLIANRGSGAFSTLEGLENLEFAENLTITGNGNLTSLRALKKLKQVPNRLEFQSNNNLPKCEIDWLLAQLEERPKEVIIMNNGSNTATCPP